MFTRSIQFLYGLWFWPIKLPLGIPVGWQITVPLALAFSLLIGGATLSPPNATAAPLLASSTTTTIVSHTPNPSNVMQAYTVTVVVSSAVGTPSGIVSVNEGPSSCTINLSSGSGSCNIVSTSAGTKTLSATYLGSINHNASGTSVSHTVNRVGLGLNIVSTSPHPSFVYQNYTVTVTTSGSVGFATGTVEISDGLASTCTITLGGTGTGSCVLNTATAGTRTINAYYSGDSKYLPATATRSHTVNRSNPTVTINSHNPHPSVVWSPYTVVVTVGGSYGTPTGTITVIDNAGATCGFTLDAGTGSCSLASSSVGNRTLAASYSGNGTYNSYAATVTHTVERATPTVVIISDDPDPSLVNQIYTVVVQVQGVPAKAIPSGQVEISNGQTGSCIVPVSGSGQASCPLTNTSQGTFTITASYSGDSYYTAASGTASHTVIRNTPSVTFNSVSPSPAYVGQNYQVFVNVSGSAGAPTGTVTISDGTGSGCTGTLSSGVANCSLSSSPAGSRTLTATYNGDTFYNIRTATRSHNIIRQTPSLEILTNSPNPSFPYQFYIIGVRITGDVAGVPNPTGIINIADGIDYDCNATISGIDAQCSLLTEAAGTHTLTITYPGNEYYEPRTITTSHTVVKASAEVTIFDISPQPVKYGALFSVTVWVSGAGTTAYGEVSVSGLGQECTAELESGVGICNLLATTVGTVTITANYSGDKVYLPASTALDHTIYKATPTVTISHIIPSPVLIGETYSVTVAVNANFGTATGIITISDGGTGSCATSLVGGGASCSLSSSTAGSLTLTASYSGDDLFTPASGTASHTVNRRPVSVTITGTNPATSTYGQEYTVNVTVSGHLSAPSGSVLIEDDHGATCTAVLDGAGMGACALSNWQVGETTLTATYSGSGIYLPGVGTLAHTVQKATPVVTISNHTPHPSTLGQAITVGFDVLGVPSLLTPTGLVEVSDGHGNTCSTTLTSGTVSGSCTLDNSDAGTLTLTATYAGDDRYTPANGTASHTVNKRPPDMAITNHTPNPSLVGQPYAVTVALGGPVPLTGTVTISDGVGGSCVATVDLWQATCSLASTTTGTQTLTATYNGDANYLTGTTTIPHTVNPAATTTSFSTNANPAVCGQPITFTAQVEMLAPASGTPVGNVNFFNGTTLMCENVALVGGQATCTVASLPANPSGHEIIVNYLGGANANPSASDPIMQVVEKADTLTALNATPYPVLYGQPVTLTATITVQSPGGGTPSGQVAFTNGGLPIAGCEAVSLTGNIATCTTEFNIGTGVDLLAEYLGCGTHNASLSNALSEAATFVVYLPLLRR